MAFTLVMDEGHFFVSSNPPLLSCKPQNGNQPHFFFPFTQIETHPFHPEQIDAETTLMPLKPISLCVAEPPSCHLWLSLNWLLIP